MNARPRLTLTAALATALTSWALRPAFAELSWLGYALAVVAVVTVGGAVSRRIGLPLAVSPLVQLLGLTLLVSALFGQHTTVFGVLPTRSTITLLVDSARSGFVDIAQLAAPVRATSGLLLLTTIGVGLVAVLVDAVAVVLRHAALAGLPLLALFAVPAAVVPGGVGWFAFVLGAVGYLALLLAESDERVSRWGRPLRSRPGTDPRAGSAAGPGVSSAAAGSPLAALGRRIGAAALGAAVILPALVPGLAGQPFGHGSGLLAGSGGNSSVTTYNPIAALQGELTLPAPKRLLTVHTDDRSPGYLRMTVLDRFDGTTWSQAPLTASSEQRVSQGLPPPSGLAEDTPRTTSRSTIHAAKDFRVPWLPAYFPVRAVDVDGDWRYDAATRTIFSTHTDTRGLTYQVTSTTPTPDANELAKLPGGDYPDDIVARDLQVPADLPSTVAELVDQLTGDQPTPYLKAVALQDYFRGPQFHYDLRAMSGNSTSALVDFLTNKRGFCEQFAAAMAVMARQAGIPARVAIGFTRGTQQPDGSWLITTSNAHAWPELYFPEVGWLRFEPTPLGDGTGVTPAYTTAGLPGPTVTPDTSSATPSTAPSVAGSGTNQPRGGNRLPENAPNAAVSTSSGGIPVGVLVVVVLVGLVLGTPLAVRTTTRRLRWRRARSPAAAAHAAWADVLDDAADLGYPQRASETPRTVVSRLLIAGEFAAPAASALRAVADAEERARYAAATPLRPALRQQVSVVRHALAGSASSMRRWRARLVPMAALRRAVGAAGDRIAGGDWTGSMPRQRGGRVAAAATTLSPPRSNPR